ncbi:AsmA family protein [Sphingobium sp. DEHP117]|uniref:AsmA family protein n=1 Tax=Sphingobium sp. DEHP117 TaxID=2993436 RepID=UPI0027D5B9D2|nr:AsmA family protein [Sphingobium sp. DEHP117]MDQ4421849.1 AsmA family protein [Sphingobium sp. DEHP117]
MSDQSDIHPLRKHARFWDRRKSVPRPLRWIVYLLLVLAVLWLFQYVTKGRFLKGTFQRVASGMLGREVRVGGDFQLYLDPVTIKFVADDMTIANPRWVGRRYLLDSRHVDARIATFRLLFGERLFKRLNVDGAALDLAWSADGKRNNWTMGDPDKRGEPLELPDIVRAQVTNTTVRYTDPRNFLFARIAVGTVASRDKRIAEAVGFQGSGTLRRRPFTLDGAILSPNETVQGGKTHFLLNARAARDRLAVDGLLPGATQFEGAQLAFRLRGSNLAEPFGLLGIAVPETRAYRFSSRLVYEDKIWKFSGLKGRFGDSDLAGAMRISTPNDRLFIDADLTTQVMDIRDVGPMVGYDPDRIDSMGADAVVTRVNGAPRVLPDAPLRAEALSRYDADVRYKVRTIRADNVPISHVDLTLKLDHSLMKLSPFTFDMSGGFVSSDIIVNARSTPVLTDYDIRLSPTPMGKLLSRWGVEENGTSGTIKARVELKGRGDTVHDSLATSTGRIAIIIPKGTMWARNVQLSELDIGVFVQRMFQKRLKDPIQINCGLVAFTVRDGVAVADPILIDTSKNVMLGRGGFSFRDESLDLSLRADAKKFSLFSAQSPIGVNGYFAAPGMQVISPELLTRGGAALGLGLGLSPLAGILAFVDFGDAKAADCGPVLQGAQAAAQRTSKGKKRKDVGGR